MLFPVNGENELYAYFPMSWLNTAPWIGRHAVTFAGDADLVPLRFYINQNKGDLADPDSALTWELDITTALKWIRACQVAPIVVVASVESDNTDEDDAFEHTVRFRDPAWSMPMDKIVLHLEIVQRGEHLLINKLRYSVAATGTLDGSAFGPIKSKSHCHA